MKAGQDGTICLELGNRADKLGAQMDHEIQETERLRSECERLDLSISQR